MSYILTSLCINTFQCPLVDNGISKATLPVKAKESWSQSVWRYTLNWVYVNCSTTILLGTILKVSALDKGMAPETMYLLYRKREKLLSAFKTPRFKSHLQDSFGMVRTGVMAACSNSVAKCVCKGFLSYVKFWPTDVCMTFAISHKENR